MRYPDGNQRHSISVVKTIHKTIVLTNTWATAILISAVLLMGGCASTPVPQSSHQASINVPPTLPKNDDSIRARLQQQYLAWKGVPYKEGGNNKQGVDCSGFVHITFKNALGVTVPRSTQLLLKTGTQISRQRLSVGDLVFFKTGRSKQHVGIYIGQNQFIHASTSQGVTKSNLKSRYWSQHYWKSARVLNL